MALPTVRPPGFNHSRATLLVLGVSLLLLAAALPSEPIAATMTRLTPDVARLAVSLFRLAAACMAVFFGLLAYTPPNWFQHRGLPRTITGFQIGPDGWAIGLEQVSWLPLFSLLLLGVGLRLYGINTDLWLDEIATLANYMRASVWENLYLYENANQHVFNSILGHFSIEAWGETAWAARAPAVVFGIGSLWALYYFARAATSEREALFATALLTVSYHHVWFSQNARGYTAMIFWGLAGMGLLLRALARNRTRDWSLYVIAMVAGAWSLLNTAFLIAAHVPAYLLMLARHGWHGRVPITRRLVVSQVAIGLGCALLYSFGIASILTYFTDAPAEARPDAAKFDVAAAVLDGITSGIGWLGLVVVGLGLVVALVGWVSFVRRSVFVAALLALPVLLNVGAVLVLSFPAYPRSFIYILPLGIIAVVRGVVVLSEVLTHRIAQEEQRTRLNRLLPVALVGLMVAASSYMLLHNYRYPKQDYQGALTYVQAQATGDEPICAVGWAASSYREYHAPDLCFPESVEEVRALVRAGHPVWVLFSFSRDLEAYSPELNDYIRSTFEPVATFPGTLGDGTLYVFRADPASSPSLLPPDGTR